MDRNIFINYTIDTESRSLSARRAWIEIAGAGIVGNTVVVALRKESVDRNQVRPMIVTSRPRSLSARRAWIEIEIGVPIPALPHGVALRKESVDRNPNPLKFCAIC